MLRFLPSLQVVPVVLASAAALAGCGATCDRVCDKLLECGEEGFLETDRFSHVECETSCERQGEVFIGWEDEQEFQEAWDEHRSCLLDAECPDIAAGACFDERFFIVETAE